MKRSMACSNCKRTWTELRTTEAILSSQPGLVVFNTCDDGFEKVSKDGIHSERRRKCPGAGSRNRTI